MNKNIYNFKLKELKNKNTRVLRTRKQYDYKETKTNTRVDLKLLNSDGLGLH